ncbi:MAG: hypothetical protein AAF826_11250 [Pseudomonadota bacterium]
MELVLVAIILAVACALIARNKGRSVVLWTILGFIFPVIALVIILLLPDSELRKLQKRVDEIEK